MASVWETLFPEGGANVDTTSLASALAALAGAEDAAPIEVEAELPDWLPWALGGLTLAVLLVAFKR
ncbi:MAG: hypothetical protein QGG40_20805 [Myxococcota bacterium]|jgi:hypothetical protein|nr:hypothetical protein [Myxococcota bacterium]|tara:strand:- start:1148 stop:1345 length:198 start_codon:yes stop_codon:yes gene_type:complete